MSQIREIRLSEVKLGMVFAGDVVNHAGLLLVARGQEVTTPLLERVRTFWHGFAHGALVQMIHPSPGQSDPGDAVHHRKAIRQTDHPDRATQSAMDPVRSRVTPGEGDGPRVPSLQRSLIDDLLSR